VVHGWSKPEMKLFFECKNGHRWKALPSSIKSGTWCRKCVYDKRRISIEEMQKIAEKREGKCVSKEYVNVFTALLWECKHGHKWMARPHAIKKGSWCKQCPK
jgi:hypothetical protein